MNPFATARRLDPCPCGSGRRYKECHGSLAPPPVLAQVIRLREGGQGQAAREALAPALREARPLADAWNLEGLLAQDARDLPAAKAAFRRAIELAPAFPEAHFNLGLALLLEGDYANGWAEYEWRTKRPGYADYSNHPFGMPRWRGEPLAGRSLLVHAEQGQGDTIQFARFLAGLAEEGATIDVFCHAPLLTLMQRMPGVRRALTTLAERPTHDFHAPILDCGALRLRSTDEAHWRAPYVRPLPERVAAWAERIRALAGPRVGFAWRGSNRHANDRNRSLSPPLAKVLLEGPAGFVNLQVEAPLPDLSRPVLDAGPLIADWEDTAAIVSQLDLVITVDTAVAHLTGAMGKPVWTLLPYSPDWRWRLEGETTPWYPSMRLFRQDAPGAWEPVLLRVIEALKTFRPER